MTSLGLLSTRRFTLALSVCLLPALPTAVQGQPGPVVPAAEAAVADEQVGVVGAELAIRMAEQAAEGVDQPGGDRGVAGEPWEPRLMRFKRDRLTLAPKPAAEQWLALIDQGLASAPVWDVYAQATTALPGPKAWPVLAEQVKARPIGEGPERALRSHSLRVFVGTLVNDQELVAESVQALEQLAEGLPADQRAAFGEIVAFLKAAVQREQRAQPQMDEEGIREMMAEAERSFAEWGDVQTLRVPDLIGSLGEETAEALLTELLAKPIYLDFARSGEQTVALGRRLMKEHIDQLAVPQWALVGGDDTVALYELLQKQFAVAKPAGGAIAQRRAAQLHRQMMSSWHMREARQDAEVAYLLALLQQEEDEKAKAFVLERFADEDGDFLSYSDFGPRAAALGVTDRAWAMIDGVMDALEDPSEDVWSAYIALGNELGKSAQVLARLDKTVADSGEQLQRDPEKFTVLYPHWYKTLLAEDQLDKAVQTIRAAMAGWPTDAERASYYTSPGETLAELGRLLDKPAWIDEGIAWMARPEHKGAYNHVLVEAYEQAGRHAEAEQLLHALLADAVKLQAGVGVNPRRHFRAFGDEGDTGAALMALANFYHRLGRHSDVLLLIEKAPWWPADDLALLIDGYGEEQAFAVSAAAALADAGRVAEARQIVRTVINLEPDHDPAYALLASINGEAALAELDLLYTRDRFEERPLIWKAHVLNQLGRHEQAATIAKQAIAVDPSDGDQGKGDRMRVYAVLADALAGLGKDEDAAFYREVVASIRMSEHADDLYSIGLTAQAAALYQQALTRFADAYCIQSRLAIRLYSMGKHEEAAEHYRRAFELMPDSFGRVESHCFGCEGVFSGEIAQDIANEVFTELLKLSPGKPQLHYLLGYLRSSQGRDAEAIKHYQRAVELDPDYVNAWRKLAYAADDQSLPAEDQDAITFNLLRLDPLGRHGGADTESVYDLERLWHALERGIALQPVLPDKLLALPMPPRPEADELDADRAQELLWEHQVLRLRGDRDRLKDPADVIAEHRVIEALDGILQADW